MKTLAHETIEQLHQADIRAALDRVVASDHLSKSPQLGNFLRFVVDKTLAGRAERIKAYSIAADALGRDANFDPQNDPIVRVEAGRLRRALDHYYANGGSNDPIVIELPRGHYVPVFRANTARRRTITRFHVMRRRFTNTVRGNSRLVVLIVVIATAVSLGLDLFWLMVARVI